MPASNPSSSCRAETLTLIVKGSASARSKTAQLRSAATCLVHDPGEQRGSQPGLLGERDEDVRADHGAVRSAPTGEGFHRPQPTGVEIDDGLEDHEDAFAVRVEQHVPKLCGECPFARTQRWVEDHGLSAAGPLAVYSATSASRSNSAPVAGAIRT